MITHTLNHYHKSRQNLSVGHGLPSPPCSSVPSRQSCSDQCDILAERLIELIEYSYHKDMPSFLKGQL
jgi:hypothetical protein